MKSDLIWFFFFLKLRKLKFIIIKFGSIHFWSIYLCFCVRYKVFSVYCKLSWTEQSSVNKEDFRLKWDLMWQEPFQFFFKLKFNSIQFWVYTFFKLIFSSSSLFFYWNTPKTYFFLWPTYIRLCWLHVHNQQANNMFGHKKI